MPRLGSDSSSSRRHNPRAVSGHHHSTVQPRHTPPKPGQSSSASLTEPPDDLDDQYSRSRPSSVRTRWNARTSGNPYASRPHSKHVAAEEVGVIAGLDDEEEGSEDADGEATALHGTLDPTQLSQTDANARDSRKRHRTNARAKANETTPDATALPPQDLLVSMSRIAKLTDSLTTGAAEKDPTALLRWVHEAFKSDGLGLASSPEQWRADVLQSIRRVERMLGQMADGQFQVTPAEIDALRQETEALEDRVRAVVEQQEKEGRERTSAGASFTDSDSAPGSDSCPSDSDTGPTEPDPAEPTADPADSPLDVQVDRTAPAPSPPSSSSIPTPPVAYTHAPPGAQAPSADAPPGTHSDATSHAEKNLGTPPEPPEDPVGYLTTHPWSMLEVFLLLEVVAHFPAAEHGWPFVTEAYNNLLITRPLQEWFSKQAAVSNEEEAGMKALLREMHKEARRLRARSAPAKTPAVVPGTTAKPGERSGSAEAHAEATARAKAATATTEATTSETTGTTVAAKDAQIMTRLPYPLDKHQSTSAPPPAQCIVPLPRRRPPLNLPSADARELTRIMRSAAAGTRLPSTESRAAMFSLYSSTKSRFPVRTSWDCWHRWCTPWVEQPEPNPEPTEKAHADVSESGYLAAVVVVDYIAGNLAAPCGTSWIMRTTSTFEYRPVPGTYPDAPGVQHRVSARYDPRPGMVAFARMTHITAEKHWTDSGLGRGEGGWVTEEALEGRRSRMPATMAGIWPGKAQSPPKRPAGARTSQSAATSGSTAPASSAKTAASTSRDPVKSDGPVGARVSPTGSSAVPASKVTRPSSAPAPPRQGAGPSTTRPQPPFVPLPQPRKPPAPEPPCVPEGTLGSTVRPGIRPWFEHAAVQLRVLERLTCVKARAAVFEEILSHSGPGSSAAMGRQSEQEEERGVWVPHHLRKTVVPPPARVVGTGV